MQSANDGDGAGADDRDDDLLDVKLKIARQALKDAEAIVAELESRAHNLERERPPNMPALARGTRDVAPEAAEATNKVQTDLGLRERVELALYQHSMNIVELAAWLGDSAGRVFREIKQLRAEGRIFNMGAAEDPRWSLRIGDNTSTSELTVLVMRLISERPMTTRELSDATGARITRVSGVIVKLQRGDTHIINVGHGHTRRWLLIRKASS